MKNTLGYVWSVLKISKNSVATGMDIKKVSVWNLEKKKLIRNLVGHTKNVYSLQYLGNKKLASASDDTYVKIWSLITGTNL
jgi:WD40 repeat protein